MRTEWNVMLCCRLVATWVILLTATAGVSPADEEPALPEGLGAAATEEDSQQDGEPELPAGLTDKKDTDEPALPPGLAEEKKKDGDGGPALPTGLEAEEKEPQPSLPPGLEADGDEAQPEKPEERLSLRERLPFDLSGFWEVRLGTRIQPDPHQQTATMGETRLQLDLEKYVGGTRLKLVTDLLYDPIADFYDLELERGRGWLDLRQANVTFSPARFADVRAGRQILTWGTGNFLFLNDLFPKDWNSFFIGRDVEYLKAPSDAAKASFFSRVANLDLVYMPRFDADRYIDGRRISYWNPQLQRRAGRDATVEPDRPNEWFGDDEWAARLHRTVGGYELAAYGYYGFWKSPSGFDPGEMQATFPELSAYGASVRGTLLGGIGNVEFSYYDSREDRDGGDPFVPNSEFRFLVGYEQEAAPNLTVGIQYYLEHMMDYSEYEDSLPPGFEERDEDHHVFTLNFTQLLWNQNLELSLFTFWSPSDNDMYFRPKANYQITDNWSVEVGGNIFAGEHRHTFFNQFRDNTNVFGAVRYGF
jgi:hypothetical protein